MRKGSFMYLLLCMLKNKKPNRCTLCSRKINQCHEILFNKRKKKVCNECIVKLKRIQIK